MPQPVSGRSQARSMWGQGPRPRKAVRNAKAARAGGRPCVRERNSRSVTGNAGPTHHTGARQGPTGAPPAQHTLEAAMNPERYVARWPAQEQATAKGAQGPSQAGAHSPRGRRNPPEHGPNRTPDKTQPPMQQDNTGRSRGRSRGQDSTCHGTECAAKATRCRTLGGEHNITPASSAEQPEPQHGPQRRQNGLTCSRNPDTGAGRTQDPTGTQPCPHLPALSLSLPSSITVSSSSVIK